MSERPNDSGLTSGDPLAGEQDPPRHESGLPGPEQPPSEPARHQSGLPGPEQPPSEPARHESGLPGPEQAPSEPARHESGLPGPEQAPSEPGSGAPRDESGPPSTQEASPEPFTGGYSSPPPPGAVDTPGHTAPGVPSYGRYTLAGWWSRVGAALIDGLIIGVGALLIVALFGSVFSIGFFASEETGVASLVIGLMLSFLAIAIIALLYAPLMMARTDGKTLGRMAMGIRVVRANGEPMTFGWAMLREVAVKALLFGMILSSITAGIAWLIDVLWPLWDDENRALHDFIVDTRVVRD